MSMKRSLLPASLLLLLSLASGGRWTGSTAKADVDLVTLPTRDAVQLTIYNSQDITMVREQRLLTVKKGVNRIQFAWTNTLIDPTSIDFRILNNQESVELLDTTFPAGRNDALQWNIRSEVAGRIAVEIRYFTSGITWSADYVGIANQAEDRLRLTGYVRVSNGSGETYENAQTRLVVGKINLVEQIAALARQAAPQTNDPAVWKSLERAQKQKLSNELQRAVQQSSALLENSKKAEEKKGVVKQGLSEYFLFAIEGREDIAVAQPKRLVSMQVDEIPLEVVYKMPDRSPSAKFTKYYRFTNKALLDKDEQPKKLAPDANLGNAPLPHGMVRLFSEYANRDLAYVGGTQTKYVPIGDRIEVNVGLDADINLARRLKDQRITNVVARQYVRRLDNTFVLHYDLIDYDETFVYEEEITSGKSKPCKVEVERRFADSVFLWTPDEQAEGWAGDKPGAYVDMHEMPGRVERVDANHVKFFVDLDPGEKQTLKYRVTYKRRKVGPELNTEKKRQPL